MSEIVDFDVLDITQLQVIQTDQVNRLAELTKSINELKAQQLALQKTQKCIEGILHKRSLQVNRWCNVADRLEARQLFQDKTNHIFSSYNSWAYMIERLPSDLCKIILVTKSHIICYVRLEFEQLDDHTIIKVDPRTYADVYYAMPTVVHATFLKNASLEIAMTQAFLCDLVQCKIPEFKSGLAAYTYNEQEKKWYRLITRYSKGNGVPAFIRTR